MGIFDDLRWARRLSVVRRRTRQTPFRADAAFVDVVPAAWQLGVARRGGRLLAVRDGQALVVVDGNLDGNAVPPGSRCRLVSVLGLAVLFTWALPLGVAVVAVSVVDRALQSAELPAGAGWLYGGSLVALWLLGLAVRLLVFAARTGATAAARSASLVTGIAPTLQVAVSAEPRGDQSWVATALPEAARRAGLPFTVEVSRLVGSRRLAQVFARSDDWAQVDSDGAGTGTLFLTNPARLTVPTEEALRQRRERWLATAPGVGLLVVGAFLFAGLVSGWLVWQADSDFGNCSRSTCTPIGDLGDSLYWGLAMVTGYGGGPPRTAAARTVAIVLELAGLVLTAALIGSVVAAWQQWSAARADRDVTADVAAWEGVGLLQPQQAEGPHPGILRRVVEWRERRSHRRRSR